MAEYQAAAQAAYDLYRIGKPAIEYVLDRGMDYRRKRGIKRRRNGGAMSTAKRIKSSYSRRKQDPLVSNTVHGLATIMYPRITRTKRLLREVFTKDLIASNGNTTWQADLIHNLNISFQWSQVDGLAELEAQSLNYRIVKLTVYLRPILGTGAVERSVCISKFRDTRVPGVSDSALTIPGAVFKNYREDQSFDLELSMTWPWVEYVKNQAVGDNSFPKLVKNQQIRWAEDTSGGLIAHHGFLVSSRASSTIAANTNLYYYKYKVTFTTDIGVF